MAKRKVLIIHDEQDSEVKQLIYVAFDNSAIDNLDIKQIALQVDDEGLHRDEINERKVKELTEAMSETDAIITVVSSDTVVNPELNESFLRLHTKDKLDDKYIIHFIFRACITEGCKWIELGDTEPGINYPFKNQDTNAKNAIIKRLLNNTAKWFETGSKKIEKVFISYSHRDGDFADLLKLKLEQRGFIVYLDIDSLTPGKKWKPKIDELIDEVNLVLLVLSPRSKSSEYVTYEWSYAMGRRKMVLPIIIEEVEEMHPKLGEIHAIYFDDRKSRDWESLLAGVEIAYNQHIEDVWES